MTRSRKKHPAGGNTTTSSEKQDKRHYNRAFRHAATVAVKTDKPMPLLKECSDPWLMNKDGKAWYGPKDPNLLRK